MSPFSDRAIINIRAERTLYYFCAYSLLWGSLAGRSDYTQAFRPLLKEMYADQCDIVSTSAAPLPASRGECERVHIHRVTEVISSSQHYPATARIHVDANVSTLQIAATVSEARQIAALTSSKPLSRGRSPRLRPPIRHNSVLPHI